MKLYATIILSLLCFSGLAQQRINPHECNLEHHPKGVNYKAVSNDTAIDITFYHINLEIAIDSPFVKGNVQCNLVSQVNGLSSFNLDLDSAFTVDSISQPASGFMFKNNVLNIQLAASYNIGDAISVKIYYHGVPVMPGGFKGLRYEMHDGNQPIIASLSTPYLAHSWWPCKDGTQDKADSVFQDFTIKDTIVAGLQMRAIGNGVLDTILSVGDSKQVYQWRHRYPVVPYYVMVAVSNYKELQQSYSDSINSFPLNYYIFDSHETYALAGTSKMPDVMYFFSKTFGPYPFANEKYGMTQLGYYGGIENQTNSIVNQMSTSWFYVSVHELAHQWFADMITCDTWHHGWLNEGFATYSESLYKEYDLGDAAYQTDIQGNAFKSGGTLYLQDVSDPFNVFQGIIYQKGAYVMHMLRGVMGDSLFFDAIYTYSNHPSLQYKKATTEDFQLICEQTSGMNLDYFFKQWIYDEYYPKYDFNFDYDSLVNQVEIKLIQTQDSIGWRPVFEMPMQISIEFSDGSDSLINVYNDAKVQSFIINFNKSVVAVHIDPFNWILKDANYNPSIPTSINMDEEKAITIYPNPVKDIMRIELQESITQIRILDSEGKIVYQEVNCKNRSFEMDLSFLTSGIYFVQVESKERMLVKQFLKN